MAKTMQFTLQFNANTDNAKRQMRDLQSAIDQAINAPMKNTQNFGLTPKLQEAQKTAMQLKTALENATNVNTGRLNLHKFNSQLRSAGLDVKTLAAQLSTLGPQGQKAFQEMASAVAAADTKVISLSSGMQRLMNTFMNTVRYQASAAAITAVTNALSEAVTFTKDLNKSLTDIWMVTKLSDEQMKKFAVSANKAAKSLRTTTNEYAKASLIYFQQGLDTSEAMKRAETTIRLSHAVGRSAEEVSEWMTAIWNNFEDGSRTIEYYADVLAKLGAETASSADEIATGLEKFAAVAETVGLSYEYAAAALATVTAETRQSADVVGTAMKTLFSRMESLKLGETLDDGTTLGQYSRALEAVGVNIKDANGELKDMDIILDETATKWQLLNRDQQVALAQSVAGVRQYSQFIALMDNYGKMQQNLERSRDSAGSLREMQEKYEQSLEGFEDKLKAAGEELSMALLDEDALKDFYKMMTELTGFVTELTKSFGGLNGILFTASSLLMSMYQPKIGNFFNSLGTNLKDTVIGINNILPGTQKRQTSAEKMRSELISTAGHMQRQEAGGEKAAHLAEKIAEAKINLEAERDKLTPDQRQIREWQIQGFETLKKELAAEEEKIELLREEQDVRASILKEQSGSVSKTVEQAEEDNIRLKDIRTSITDAADGVEEAGTNPDLNDEERQQAVGAYAEHLERARKKAEELRLDVQNLGFNEAEQAIKDFAAGGETSIDELVKKLQDLQTNLQNQSMPEQVKIREIDTDYIRTKSSKVGILQANADAALETASGMKSNATYEERVVAGDRMEEALALTKKQAEELGIEIKDLGFDEATSDVRKFVSEGNEHLNQLLKKLQEIQGTIHERSGTALDEIADNAIMGAADANMAALNTLDVSGSGENIAASVSQLQSGNLELSKDQKGLVDQAAQWFADGEKGAGKYIAAIEKAKKAVESARKAVEAAGKDEKKRDAAQKKLEKTKKNLIKAESDYGAAAKKQTKNLRDQTSAIRKNNSEKVKGTKEYQAALASTGPKVQECGQKEAEAAKQTEELERKMRQADDALDGLGNKAEKMDIGKAISKGLSGIMSVFSGLNTLRNGVAQLTTSLDEGENAWSHYLSAISAIGMGFAQLIGPASSVLKFIKSQGAAALAASAKNKQAAKIDAQAEQQRQGENLKTGTTAVAKHVAVGNWVLAAAGAAALALMGIGVVTSMMSGTDQSEQEEQQKQNEKNQKVSAAATEVSKGLQGLSESVDTFKNLRESGESTLGVLEEMKGQIKDLDFQIDELFKAGASEQDWAALKGLKSELIAMYELLKDNPEMIDQYKGLIDKVTLETNRVATRKAMENMRNSTNEEELAENRDAYMKQIGTTVTSNDDLLKQVETDFLKGTYTDADAAEKAWADLMIEAALGPEYAGQDWAESPEAISALLNYATPKVHQIITNLRSFAPGGDLYNKYNGDQGKLNAIKSWAGKDATKNAYLSQIDFSQDQNTWDTQLRTKLDKAEEARITQEAEKAGFDAGLLETYSNYLQETNGWLDENDKTTKRLALTNLQLNKGLNELAGAWGEISNILEDCGVDTIAYSEAVAKLQDILETTFGFRPSEVAAVDSLELIQKIATGTTDEVKGALTELQRMLGQDYIDQMEIKTGNVDATKSWLKGALGTVDLANKNQGDEVDVSGILYGLQHFLNQGAYTPEGLEQMLRTSGIEVEFDQLDPTNLNKAKFIKSGSVDETTFRAQKKQIEQLREEKDIYYDHDKILNKLQRTYDKLSKSKDRAFGTERIEAINNQISTTLDLLNETENKLKTAQTARNGYQEILEKNFHAKFDDEGNLLNYSDMYDYVVNTYGLNSEKMSEFNAAMSGYEDESERIVNLENEKENYNLEIKDLGLEAVEYTVEVKVELNDASLELVEYQLEHLVDPITNSGKALELIGKKADSSFNNMKVYQDAISIELGKILSEDELAQFLATGDINIFKDKRIDSKALESIKSWYSGIVDEMNNLYAIDAEFMQTFSDSIEGWNEKFTKVADKVTFLNSTLETYRNIVDLVGRKNLNLGTDYLINLSNQTVKNSIAGIQMAQSQLLTNQKLLDDMRAQRETELANASEGDYDKIAKKWDDQIDAQEARVQELKETVQSSWTDALSAAANAFETSVNMAAEAFEEAMSGVYGTFEALQSAFDRAQKVSEQYLDNYTQIYELSKLNRNISKSLDATDNVKATAALRELQEEITSLQASGAKITQYDLEYLQKKYDLRVAEIALEDAQNAKSQVRMRRDSEGNYSYVYTADQSNVDAAQQGYEDKLYATQSHTQKRIDDLQNQIVENERQMLEDLKALPLENYKEEKQRVLEYYADQEKYLLAQIEIAIGNSAEIYTTDWQKYSEMTGYKLDANSNWVDSWEETVLAQLTGFSEIEDYYDTFNTSTKTLTDNLSQHYSDWQTNISLAFEAAGSSFEEFGGPDGKATEALNGISDKLTDFIKQFNDPESGLVKSATDAFDELIQKAGTWSVQFATSLSPAIAAGESLVSNLAIAIQLLSGMPEKYYGTYTIDGVTYRTEKMYNTEDAAKDAAITAVKNYNAAADKYNTDSQSSRYQVIDENDISNIVSSASMTSVVADGGTSYRVGGPSVDKYVAPPPPEPTEPQSYYGVYTVGGQTFRTDTSFSSADIAQTEAHIKAQQVALDQYNAHREHYTLTGEEKYKIGAEAYLNEYNRILKMGYSASGAQGVATTDIGSILPPLPTDTKKHIADLSDGGLFTEGMITHFGIEPSGVLYAELINDRKLYFAGRDDKGPFAPGRDHNSFLALMQSYPNATTDEGVKISRSGDLMFYDNIFDPYTIEEESAVLEVTKQYPAAVVYNPKKKKLIEVKGDERKAPPVGLQVRHANLMENAVYDSSNKIWWYYMPHTYTENGFSTEAITWAPADHLKLVGYDTGGYTGSWDSSGRLAMLHQKEIVLNAHDTENFLSAINIVRDIASMIDLRAAAQQSALSAITSATVAPFTQTLQQEVTIHAEFPNATQRTEIEAAFDTLLNRASQFANRKN